MSAVHIRSVREGDGEWIRELLRKEWGSVRVVSKGVLHYPDSLPGFIAEADGTRQGLLTYRVSETGCEIITLNSLIENQGLGSALIDEVRQEAYKAGCKRLWLITTNDNLKAIRFYQKREFIIAAIHLNAIEESRKLKPEIPLFGIDGIPIRDEIEMEMML